MTFKEKTEALKKFISAKMKEDMSSDEIEEFQNQLKSIDELEKEFSTSEDERAKLKNKIVDMVLTQGDDEPPSDDHDGSKPMTMEEAIKQATKEEK